MNELALFAGAGGGILGSILLGWRIVAAVEIDPYCREGLLRRQEDLFKEGWIDHFPIWDDIRTFSGRSWRGKVDIVTAGFPCQPFSAAGKRGGESDPRNLWPDTVRVIREVGPRFALLENSADLLTDPYFGAILGDLAESGYNAKWECIPAAAVGSRQIRDRVWILATAGSLDNSHSVKPGDIERWTPALWRWMQNAGIRLGLDGTPWASEFGLDRVAYGIPHRVVRNEAIGNGQVPAVVVAAWKLLGGVDA